MSEETKRGLEDLPHLRRAIDADPPHLQLVVAALEEIAEVWLREVPEPEGTYADWSRQIRARLADDSSPEVRIFDGLAQLQPLEAAFIGMGLVARFDEAASINHFRTALLNRLNQLEMERLMNPEKRPI